MFDYRKKGLNHVEVQITGTSTTILYSNDAVLIYHPCLGTLT
jgi:hypothetical protein